MPAAALVEDDQEAAVDPAADAREREDRSREAVPVQLEARAGTLDLGPVGLGDGRLAGARNDRAREGEEQRHGHEHLGRSHAPQTRTGHVVLRATHGACHGSPMRIDLELDADDARVLRGALLAARAGELAEAQRRGFRHSYGKGSDSALKTMTAEVAHHRRRIELLDRLIAALEEASEGPGRP